MGINTSYSDFKPPFRCWRYEPWDQEAQDARVKRAAWHAWKDSEAKLPLDAILEMVDRKGVLLVNWCSTFCRARWGHHFGWAWEQCGEDPQDTWHYVCEHQMEYGGDDHIVNPRPFRPKSGDHQKAYWTYMASTEWFDKRTQVLARSRRQCAHCPSTNATQVHHKTYARLGCERLEDLEAICMPCHEKEHNVAATG